MDSMVAANVHDGVFLSVLCFGAKKYPKMKITSKPRKPEQQRDILIARKHSSVHIWKVFSKYNKAIDFFFSLKNPSEKSLLLCVPKEPQITLTGGTTGLLLIVKGSDETMASMGMLQAGEKGIRKGTGYQSLRMCLGYIYYGGFPVTSTNMKQSSFCMKCSILWFYFTLS